MGKALNTIRDKSGKIKFVNLNPMKPHEIDVIIFENKEPIKGKEFWVGRKVLKKVNKRIKILEE